MGQDKNTDLEAFMSWLVAELGKQSELTHSHDFTTRKTALVRFEELTQAQRAVMLFLRLSS